MTKLDVINTELERLHVTYRELLKYDGYQDQCKVIEEKITDLHKALIVYIEAKHVE